MKSNKIQFVSQIQSVKHQFYNFCSLLTMHLEIFLKSCDLEFISTIFLSNSSSASFMAASSLVIKARTTCLYFFNKEITQLLGTSVYLTAPNATVTTILHVSIDNCIPSFSCSPADKKNPIVISTYTIWNL